MKFRLPRGNENTFCFQLIVQACGIASEIKINMIYTIQVYIYLLVRDALSCVRTQIIRKLPLPPFFFIDTTQKFRIRSIYREQSAASTDET